MANRRTFAPLLANLALSSILCAATAKILTYFLHGYFDSKHSRWIVYLDFAQYHCDWRLVLLTLFGLFIFTPVFIALRLSTRAPISLLEHRWSFITFSLMLFVATILNLQISAFYLLSGYNTIAPF